MDKTSLAPVVMFVYNRPAHTLQALEALSRASLAKSSVLYIYSDGPPENVPQDKLAQIQEVRAVIRQRQWCGEVHIVESSWNKGLAASIVSGVTAAVNQHGRVIVLEDDVLISSGFLEYSNAALELYKDDKEVMHVSAAMYDASVCCGEDTCFLRVMSCQGWSTWKRAWDYYNNDALDHLAYFHANERRAFEFDVEGSAYFMKQLLRNVTGELNSWAVRWYASWLRAGGISLFPRQSLVRNIGFDNSGVNCVKGRSYLGSIVETLSVVRLPIQEDKEIRRAVAEFWTQYRSDASQPGAASRCGVNKSKRFEPLWKIGRKVSRRILLRMFPEWKPLLDAGDRLSWHGVVTGIKGSWIDKSVILYDPVHISFCRIHARTYIAQNAWMSYTEVGKFCSIGPHLRCGWGIHPTNGISTSPTFYSASPTNGFAVNSATIVTERKKITIGNDVFIGMNVSILDGVSIGDGAVIGAGCVVSKDVPAFAIVVGNPMRILRYRFPENIIEKLLEIAWWDWPEAHLPMIADKFFDIDEFIKQNDRSGEN